MKSLFVYLILLVSVLGWSHRSHDDSRRVLLSSVQTLTFYDNKYTTGKRSSPIRQMTCTSGYSNCKHMPSSIQCYNRGTDGVDVQWECKANMENGYDLGKTEVSCEGYDYPEDPYILAGSCGISFEVKQTSMQYNQKPYYKDSYRSPQQYESFTDRLFSMVWFVGVIAFIIFMIGFNNILSILWTLIKVVFFPIYLMSCCCCCPHGGPAYARYTPPPPPVFDNAFGHGLWWYNRGRADGERDAYYRRHQSDGVFHSHRENWYRENDRYEDDDHHESTSYASTSRR